MRLHRNLGLAIGVALLVGVLIEHDGRQIVAAVVAVGWGLIALCLIHPVQTALAGLAWRALLPQAARPGWLDFALLRWIRESVNGLLPVAQLGGNVVGARLMTTRFGVPLHRAAASTAVDLTLETVTQVLFAVIGVALLITGPYPPAIAHWVGAAIGAASVVVCALVIAQKRGLFRLLEALLLRLAQRPSWAGLGDAAGLHDDIVALYQDRRRLTVSGLCHLASWLLGAAEIWVALRLVGVAVDLRQALLIESIGQAVRTAGFAIPGSLGVQEGGTVLICGIVGIGPESALELALLKRVRELALGLPGLLAWHFAENSARRDRPPPRPALESLR